MSRQSVCQFQDRVQQYHLSITKQTHALSLFIQSYLLDLLGTVNDPVAGKTTSVPLLSARTTLMMYSYSTPGVRLLNVTVCWRVDEGKVVVVGPS